MIDPAAILIPILLAAQAQPAEAAGDRVDTGGEETTAVEKAQTQDDDKIICSHRPLSRRQRLLVVAFFRLYAKCKWVLNLVRGQAGRSACEGWGDALSAIARARPFDRASWKGPAARF